MDSRHMNEIAVYTVALFLLSGGMNAVKFIEPCRNQNDNGNLVSDEWFVWGRLYSFCAQYDSATEGIPSAFDGNCSTDKCKQCISVCQNSTKKLSKCEEGCDTDPCKKGCRFFAEISAGLPGNFSLDNGNKPHLISSTVMSAPTMRSIRFKWQPVVSNGDIKLSSFYLIAIQGSYILNNKRINDSEYALGLVHHLNYTASLKDLCANVYSNYYYEESLAFQLKVYPINFNGPGNKTEALKFALLSELTRPVAVPPTKNISVSLPLFGSSKSFFASEEYTIKWIISWLQENDEDIVELEKDVKVSWVAQYPAEKMIKMNSIGNLRKFPALYAPLRGSAEIYLMNDEDDVLSGCNASVSMAARYGGCFLGAPSLIAIPYKGCKTVKDYGNECPPPMKPIYTYIPKTDLSVNYTNCVCENYTRVLCPDQSTSKCRQCVLSRYDVIIKWNPPVFAAGIKTYRYTVRWGNVRFKMISSKSSSSISLPANATSYLITNIYDNITLGVQVNAETNYSKKWHNAISSVNTVEFPDPEIMYITIPKPSPSSSSSKSTAIIVVVVVVLVAVLSLLLLVYFRKRRNHKMKELLFGDKISMQPEKGVISDEWEISPDCVIIGDQIGCGAFGTVYRATIELNVLRNSKYAKQCGGAALLSGKTVAVKFLKEGAQEAEYKDFEEEIGIMKKIAYHKNIVNMIGCSTIKQPLCLIVEFMQNGDLLSYMRKNRSKQLEANNELHESVEEKVANDLVSTTNMMSFAWQIACGMEYLASNSMVHRDLAARNVLVGNDNCVKISDFGLSRYTSDDIYVSNNKTRKLPIKWMSIEAIFHQEFTTASDVWSYGVVLFEIVTLGGTPYPAIDSRHLGKMLKSGYRMEKPDNCKEAMYNIMCHCWNADPMQRPTFSELREHLEKIISESDLYFSFDIDEDKIYYNVASFRSVPSDDDDDGDAGNDEYRDPPVLLKTFDDETCHTDELGNKKVGDSAGVINDARYVSPQALKTFSDVERLASFDNPTFHATLAENL